jgi:hypothetical protein
MEICMTLVANKVQLKSVDIVQDKTTQAPISYQQKSEQHFFLTHIGGYFD